MTYLNEYLTLEISPTERVAVYPEEQCFPVEDFVGDELGIFTLHKDRHLSNIEQGTENGLLHRLMDKVNRDQEESAIGKYLATAGFSYKFVSLRGYSQSDWADVVIYAKDPSLLLNEDSLKSWFRGDIYYLSHEKLVTFTSPDSDRVIESWETLDSIGAVMLDNYEDTKAFARVDFGIELPEEATE
jgi:hypothetical protein